MTGRERVTACLRFQTVDRAPRDLWALPYVLTFQKQEFQDIVEQYPLDFTRPQLTPGWNDHDDACSRVGLYTDEWGSVWQVGEPGVVGEVKQPALADLTQLGSYQPPWSLIDTRDIDRINRSCATTNNFVLSEVAARPFERMQFLRGTEQLFIDLAYGTKETLELLEIVHDFYLKDVESWCKTDVDGVFLMDDWGTNDSLLISPDMWRQLFKPLYQDYCDLIHASGKFAFFHTDGYTFDVYGDMIAVGIDAINSQLFRMDIEELALRYKGQVTFWGELDRQHILPFGTLADVHEAVLRVRNALDDGQGGVIAQCEWGKGNRMENIAQVFRSWLDDGLER